MLLLENIILGAQLGCVGFLGHEVCYVNSAKTVHINHYCGTFPKSVKTQVGICFGGTSSAKSISWHKFALPGSVNKIKIQSPNKPEEFLDDVVIPRYIK